MRDAWPVWKAAALVSVGVFAVYAIMYRDRSSIDDPVDFLARGLVAAAFGGLVAGALQIARNRSATRNDQEEEPDDRDSRAVIDPPDLADHEAGGGPRDIAGSLADEE
jgi:hypothetical protein